MVIILSLSLPLIAGKYLFYDSQVLRVSDYISDEQWYVAASINMYRKLFHITLVSKYNETYYQYTFFLRDNCTASDIIRDLTEKGIKAHVLNVRSFTKVNAVVIATSTVVNDTVVGNNTCIADYMPGVAPNEANINNYLNMEHPPLVKYIIGISMILLGVNNYGWRLPSLIVGYMTIVVLVAIAYEYTYRYGLPKRDKKIVSFILAYTVLAAALLYDKLFLSLSSITLLDIYVAFFTLLALYVSLRQRYLLAAILVGLAGSSKMTGLFAIPWLYLAMRIDNNTVKKSLAYSLLIPILVYFLVNTPLIAVYGIDKWFNELYSALKWHTSSRPPGPPSTNPLGLIMTLNPFPLYYIDGVLFLVAKCNLGICVYGLLLALATLVLLLDTCYNNSATVEPPPSWLQKEKMIIKNGLLLISAWSGYWAVYLAGNHTLYTFYTIHLQPLLLTLVVASITHFDTMLVKPVSLMLALRLKHVWRNLSSYCTEKYAELRLLVNISRSPLIEKLSAITITYIFAITIYLVQAGIVDPSNTILVKPCIHHYGFNPLDSFLCLYMDKTTMLIIVSLSLLLWIDYIHRKHRLDNLLIYTLVTAVPLFLSSLTQSLSALFLPIFLLYAMNRENSFSYGFLMGVIAPSPLFAAIAFQENRSLAGFVAGFAAAHVFMFSQEGIDYFLQAIYLAAYSLIALILVLLARFYSKRTTNTEKVYSLTVATSAIASMPCGLLLFIYPLYYMISRRAVLRAAIIASILSLIEFYYPLFPPLPIVQSSFYIAVVAALIIAFLGVKSVQHLREDNENIYGIE